MADYNVNMNEGSRGSKRGREVGDGADRSSAQRRDSVDSITKRLAVLGGLEPVGEHAEKRLEIAIPTAGNRVEYYPADYAQHKFRGKVDIRNFPKLIKDGDGPSRPLPQAYESIKVDPGTTPQEAKQIRDAAWDDMKEELGFGSKPSNGKVTWDKLERNDEGAWYDTPAGPHRTTYAWRAPEKAGQNLPELRITQESSNSRGSRTTGMWRNDPEVVGKDINQIAAKYGPKNVEIKDKNHCFDSVANLNKRGEHEAERLFAQIAGNEIRYNRDLPDMIVQHKSHLVSVADIQNTKLWAQQPILKTLNDALEQRPGSLRIGMSTREGDSLHSPQLMKKQDKSLFEATCEKHGLVQDRLAKNGKFLKGGPWVQTAEGLLEDANKVKERLVDGETLTGKYKTTQIYGASQVARGENQGSAKSLYATMRDNGPIPPEVATVLDIKPRLGGREDYKQQAKLNTTQALQAYDSSSSLDGDTKMKSEPNSARQSLVEGRQGVDASRGV